GLVRFFFFCQAEDGIRDFHVTGVQTCALPIYSGPPRAARAGEKGKAGAAPRAAAPAGTAGPRRAPRRWPGARRRLRPKSFPGRKDRKSVVEGKSVDRGGRRLNMSQITGDE